jgi:glycosyltransferase involved in cell wall biosynthesis
MKVLLTHEMFPPDFGGGGEYVVLRVTHGLREAGVDVRVLTAGAANITSFEGIPTTRLPISRYRFNLAVRTVLKNARDVDLIQTFSYHAVLPSLIAGRILKKPVVCYMLAFYPDLWRKLSKSPIVGQARVWWEHFLVTREYARIIFPTQDNLDRAIAAGIRPERALLNSPAIDLELYTASHPKEDAVLFSGKLEERKGIYDYLAVARALPHIPFRVMGSGPDEERVRRMASPNVEFIKFERGEPLRKAFAAARIFMLPSMGETFGLAVLEAMASGCAVISSVPLGFRGAHIRAGDQPGMTREVARLYGDRELTFQMGAANVKLASQFSWSQHIRTLLDVYSDVLGPTNRLQ